LGLHKRKMLRKIKNKEEKREEIIQEKPMGN
jgi:hypothetical protein